MELNLCSTNVIFTITLEIWFSIQTRSPNIYSKIRNFPIILELALNPARYSCPWICLSDSIRGHGRGHGHWKLSVRGHGRGNEFSKKSRTRTWRGQNADTRVHRSLNPAINLYSRIWHILIMISNPFEIKISSTTSIFSTPASIFSTPITTLMLVMRPISSLMDQEMNTIQSISPKVWIIIHSRILRIVHIIWTISKRFYFKNQCRKCTNPPDNDSEIEWWICRSTQNPLKITLFKFRVVQCRIRHSPTLISTIIWLGSWLPLIITNF